MGLIPGPMQCVKDPAVPLLWHRSQLQLGFSPWPGNFHMLQTWPKKEKKYIYDLGGHSAVISTFHFLILDINFCLVHILIPYLKFVDSR